MQTYHFDQLPLIFIWSTCRPTRLCTTTMCIYTNVEVLWANARQVMGRRSWRIVWHIVKRAVLPINMVTPKLNRAFIFYRVGWGKMSMVGQSRSLEIFICMPKLREPMVIRSTFLFSHWNRESKTDDPVIISSLALTKNII